MHITITGNLGSGKSTICKYLSGKHGFEVYSAGKIQREMARKLNIDTLEMNHLMSQDTKYDHLIDSAVIDIANRNKEARLIFDSRLAWNFVPASFKVFLFVDLNVAAARVVNDNRDAEEFSTPEEAKNKLYARACAEIERYKQIYNVNYMDFSNYDIVIDNSFGTVETVAGLIIDNAEKFFSAQPYVKKILLSPKNLYPTRNAADINEDLLNRYIQEYSSAALYADTEISVFSHKNHYFILDGHVRAMASVLNCIPYIPVKIDTLDKFCGCRAPEINQAFIRNYEDICKFKFLSYPEL